MTCSDQFQAQRKEETREEVQGCPFHTTPSSIWHIDHLANYAEEKD